MAAIIDFSTTNSQETDEVINVADANPVNLDHDILYNKTGKLVSIWTGAGSTGTELTDGVDYDIGGTFPDGSLPTSISPDVAYTTVAITNVTYQSTDLYVSYYPISDIINAARWNAVNNPGTARATRATAQSMANGVYTKVIFNVETWDNLGEYDITTGVFTATYTGYYQVNASVLSASVAWATNESWLTVLYKNGAIYSAGMRKNADVGTTDFFGSTYSDLVYLAAGEYIDIRVLQNQGAAVNTLNDGVYNYLSVHRMS